jgi:Ion channel
MTGAADPKSSPLGLALQKHAALMRTSGMSLLLVFLIAGIFVIPAFFHPAGARSDDFLIVMILVGGIIAVAEYHRIAIVLVVLTVGFLLMRWSGRALLITSPVYRDAVMLSAMILLSAAVGFNVFGRGHALGDRVFGAIVLYLMLAIIWAFAYALVDREVPHAFAGQLDKTDGFVDWGYFSLVTLTTVGYGDITPVARVARSLATAEALIGQLYPAIIIARLVSLQASDR